MIKSYIEIMKFAYELDIHTDIDLDEGIGNYYSIRLFLQPLVENAVMHGIKPKGTGFIGIRGEKKDNQIFFNIYDDGVGIKPEVLELLNSTDEMGSEKCGYGLMNVKNRLELFFGPSYGLNILSEPGKGMEIIINIPVFTEDEIKAYLKDRSIY